MSKPLQPPAIYEQNFSELCRRTLTSLSSMVKDARDAGLSDIDPTKLDSVSQLLKLASPSDLISAFIGKRAFWKKIEAQEMTFLTTDVKDIFSEAGIDTATLAEPIRVYLLLKSQPASKTPPCINDEDINILWKKFELMIKLSVKWNAVTGNKHDLSAYSKYLTM